MSQRRTSLQAESALYVVKKGLVQRNAHAELKKAKMIHQLLQSPARQAWKNLVNLLSSRQPWRQMMRRLMMMTTLTCNP